jgi:hypothetical protein
MHDPTTFLLFVNELLILQHEIDDRKRSPFFMKTNHNHTIEEGELRQPEADKNEMNQNVEFWLASKIIQPLNFGKF